MFSILPSYNRGLALVMITTWYFLFDMPCNSLKLAAWLSHIVRRTIFDLKIMFELYIYLYLKIYLKTDDWYMFKSKPMMIFVLVL